MTLTKARIAARDSKVHCGSRRGAAPHARRRRPSPPPTTLRWPRERCEISRQKPRSDRHAQRRRRGGQAAEAGDGGGALDQPNAGRPPPNGSAAGRSRLQHSASIDRTPLLSRSGSKPASCGNKRPRCARSRRWCRGRGAVARDRSFRRVADVTRVSRWNGCQLRNSPPGRLSRTRSIGPDFHACRAAYVGLDHSDARVVERDRYATLREEVDDGGAAESEAARLNHRSVRHRAVQVDENIHPVARRDERLGSSRQKSMKQEFRGARRNIR